MSVAKFLLQNHLIETASHSTGSLLIWDTGEYSVLPYRQPRYETDDELSNASDSAVENKKPPSSEPQKLHEAFQMVETSYRLMIL